MSDNPYGAPPVLYPPPPSPAQGVYRPADFFVNVLTFLFLANVGLDLLNGACALAAATVYAEVFARPELADPSAQGFILAAAGLGLLTIPLWITTVVFFCMWVYRANKNARALGALAMRHSAGWSVGYFFIPIANLFMPYQAIQETYRASDPDRDSLSWKLAWGSSLIGWWWAAWIAQGVLGQIQFRLALSGDPDLMHLSDWAAIPATVSAVAASLLAMQVVRTMHRRQEEKASRAVVL